MSNKSHFKVGKTVQMLDLKETKEHPTYSKFIGRTGVITSSESGFIDVQFNKTSSITGAGTWRFKALLTKLDKVLT